jgi:hypothetical protein
MMKGGKEARRKISSRAEVKEGMGNEEWRMLKSKR